jgi:hypothetical protein
MKTIQYAKWDNKIESIRYNHDCCSHCKKCKDAILVDELIQHVICGSQRIKNCSIFKLDENGDYICNYLNTGD